VARRKRHRVHGRHRRSRRHHRNPFRLPSGRGLVGRITEGFKGGLAVLGGEAVASAVPKLIPVPSIQTGMLNTAAEMLVAVFTAPLVQKVLGPKWAQAYLYGGFARPLRGVVMGLNLPIISPALASYPGSLMALPANTGVTSLAGAYDAGFMDAEELAVQ